MSDPHRPHGAYEPPGLAFLNKSQNTGDHQDSWEQTQQCHQDSACQTQCLTVMQGVYPSPPLVTRLKLVVVSLMKHRTCLRMQLQVGLWKPPAGLIAAKESKCHLASVLAAGFNPANFRAWENAMGAGDQSIQIRWMLARLQQSAEGGHGFFKWQHG